MDRQAFWAAVSPGVETPEPPRQRTDLAAQSACVPSLTI